MPPDPEPPDFPSPPPPLAAALVADAVVAHAATPAAPGHHGPTHTHCENCAAPLQGPYCHRCGQHDFDINRSFGHTFLEALENFFHFDTKLFRNIVTLLFRPGRLTADFNGGKRASQVPPFRFYVFISILFFFLTFIDGDRKSPLVYDPEQPAASPDTAAGSNPGTTDDSTPATKPLRRVDQLRAAADAIREEAVQDLNAAEETAAPAATPARTPRPEPAFVRALVAKAEKMQDPHGRAQVGHAFLGALPKLLLLCLPFFALYTRFLFRKSGRVYLQHLVLALHFHTFVFIWLMVRDGWSFLAGLPGWGLDGWVTLAGNLWLCVYPFLMLRHLFANSWPRTLVKTALLGFAYALTLALVFSGAAVAILMLVI